MVRHPLHLQLRTRGQLHPWPDVRGGPGLLRLPLVHHLLLRLPWSVRLLLQHELPQPAQGGPGPGPRKLYPVPAAWGKGSSQSSQKLQNNNCLHNNYTSKNNNCSHNNIIHYCWQYNNQQTDNNYYSQGNNLNNDCSDNQNNKNCHKNSIPNSELQPLQPVPV